MTLSMKVRVALELRRSKAMPGTGVELILAVGPDETVLSLKQRIATVQPVPFLPQQKLTLSGVVLEDSATLSACGVADKSLVEMVVTGTEEDLVSQLREILRARPLSPTEIVLLYGHQHGCHIQEALKLVAAKQGEILQEFLRRRSDVFETKTEGSLISLVLDMKPKQSPQGSPRLAPQTLLPIREDAEDASTATVQVVVRNQQGAQEMSHLELLVQGASTVLSLKERITAAELIPFQDMVLSSSNKELNDADSIEAALGAGPWTLRLEVEATEEALVKQLAGLLKVRSTSAAQLSDLYCYRFGAPAGRALKLLGLKVFLKDFIARHSDVFAVEKGCISLASKATPVATGPSTSCSKALEAVISALMYSSFLRPTQIWQKGESSSPDLAEATAFFGGLPTSRRAVWLPPLLKATEVALTSALGEESGLQEVVVMQNFLELRFNGPSAVRLHIAAERPSP